MKPTYHHLQVVLLDKNSDEYIPGDVIAFYSEGLSCVLVKRIIAGPGDSAQIVDGTLLVNGQISQIYPDIGMISDPGIMAEPAKLGPEQYLVLGDNLSQSIDSRYLEVGIVFEGEIFGKIYTGK